MNKFQVAFEDFRKRKNMKIIDVAEKIGATKQAMYSIIKNGNPCYDTIIKISDALGVKPGDFF